MARRPEVLFRGTHNNRCRTSHTNLERVAPPVSKRRV